MKQRLGVDSTLIAGSGGVFEVTADGEVVFAKKSVGRFPEPGEVSEMLQKK